VRRLLISLATLLGVMGVGLVAGPAAVAGASGSGGTLYVSTTGANTTTCRLSQHPCKTITYAVSQAAVGSVIKVAAGTYAEQVFVQGAGLNNITIKGAGSGTTIVEPSTLPQTDTDSDSSTVQDAIVDVNGATGVTIKGITVNGAAASDTFTGCGVGYDGVYFHNASGTLSKVAVTNVALPTADFGCQQGQAVYVTSDAGKTSDVTMTKVAASGFDKNGITCDDPGTTCLISGSTVTGAGPITSIAQNGIQVYGSSATLTHDTVNSLSYTAGGADATGILVINAGSLSLTGSTMDADDAGAYLLEDTSPGWVLQSGTTEGTWTVSGNTADRSPSNPGGGPGEGFGDGIDIDSTTAPVTVSNNKVENDDGFGIGIYGADGATVTGNTAEHDVNGVYLGAGSVAATATDNDVSNNTANTNSNDGILADTTTSNNSFSSNMLKHDVTWGAQDLSSGTGTAGTANTWHSNVCAPAHDGTPLGVC
jgi:parallel beta-helix repeat protein